MNQDGQPELGVQPQALTAVMPWFMGGPWVPRFSGGEAAKFAEWKTQIEACIRAQGSLNVQQRVDFVLNALEGDAKREVALLAIVDRDTEIKILAELGKLYGRPQPVAQLRVTFFNCKQEPGEDLKAFILRLRELNHRWRAQDPLQTGTDDELLRTQFVTGLRAGPVKQELQRQLRRNPLTTFAEACQEARALERELGGPEESLVCPVFAPASKGTPPTTPDWQQVKEDLRKELRQELKEQMSLLTKSVVEELQQQLRTSQTAMPPTAAEPSLPSWRPQSNNPQRQRLGSAPPGPSQYLWDAQGRAICRDCGEAGHIQRFCPRRRPQQDFHHSRSRQGQWAGRSPQ